MWLIFCITATAVAPFVDGFALPLRERRHSGRTTLAAGGRHGGQSSDSSSPRVADASRELERFFFDQCDLFVKPGRGGNGAMASIGTRACGGNGGQGGVRKACRAAAQAEGASKHPGSPRNPAARAPLTGGGRGMRGGPRQPGTPAGKAVPGHRRGRRRAAAVRGERRGLRHPRAPQRQGAARGHERNPGDPVGRRRAPRRVPR